ncbi:helix-turn-helix domain-containing protein [Lentzea albidocapillata]|uniref:helix-turn-helix domain-containing protein n=1 Tax=Lentzea albidocapillata TaxID=40571 RepID=UPI0013564596|nr:helix-turn-helix domain-containing protein [Lentzea albidocapillata]
MAAYLQVSKATLRDQRHRNVGVGALATKVGKHLRWRWEDIERYIDEQASVPVGGSAA